MALHHGINTRGFRTYAELKAAYPNQPDGVYALFPFGPSGPVSISHCITYQGEHYQAVISQFGGPRYSTYGNNASNAELFGNRSSYDGVIQPFDVDGQMYSRINNNGYDYWAAQTGTKWLKRTRTYTATGALRTENNYSHEVLLKFENGTSFGEAFQASAGYKLLNGVVSMQFTLGIEGELIDFGSTSNLYSQDTSIGFANQTDNNGGTISQVMGNGQGYWSSVGWEARHVLSYVHTSNGYNATRCQFVCWSGSEDAAMEQLWYVKYINE
jgi:hypothetical protein